MRVIDRRLPAGLLDLEKQRGELCAVYFEAERAGSEVLELVHRDGAALLQRKEAAALIRRLKASVLDNLLKQLGSEDHCRPSVASYSRGMLISRS
jgi:hypothetical protein